MRTSQSTLTQTQKGQPTAQLGYVVYSLWSVRHVTVKNTVGNCDTVVSMSESKHRKGTVKTQCERLENGTPV